MGAYNFDNTRVKLFSNQFLHNVIKVPHRYDVQVSDTTMFNQGSTVRP